MITLDNLVDEMHKYVGEHIVFPDFTILEITTYVQGNFIYNIIKYSKDNKIDVKKVKTRWYREK